MGPGRYDYAAKSHAKQTWAQGTCDVGAWPGTIATMEITIAIVVAAVVVTYVWHFTVARKRRGEPRDMSGRMAAAQQIADIDDPERRFAQGVLFMITAGRDHGYADDPDVPRRSLERAWEIANRDEALETIERFLTGPAGPKELAFNMTHAILLSRNAAGAGLIDHATSWQLVRRACDSVRQEFAGWSELGAAYIDAVDEWNQSQGRAGNDQTAARVAWCQERIWPTIAFIRGSA